MNPNPVKILIVEDELLIARSLAKKLKKIGYVITNTVSSHYGAIASIEQQCPDLVLMDIVIKGEKDGIDTATEINERFDLPIIYLTAYADDLTIQRAEQTGSYGYILKPYSEKELHASITIALHKHNQYKTALQRSIIDPLTELFNRRYMEETFQKELARATRHEYSISVILIDIDYFKRINDNYGHNTGDRVLQEIAILLQHSVRSSDIVCRYGGEEIVILLPECDLEQAFLIAESMRKAISKMTVNANSSHLQNITISAGVACFPQHGLTSLEVIESADQALYLAKNKGRNQVQKASKGQ